MTQHIPDPDTDSRRYDRFFELSRDRFSIADFGWHFVRVDRAFA